MLDRVEQRLEQVMEGSIGRIFRSPIQPAEIGQKLERAMTERPVASVTGKLVPNDFRVRLNPRDLAQFAAYQSALQQQLADWLADVAQRRGLRVVDQIRVELTASDRLPRRAIEVTAIITEREPRREASGNATAGTSGTGGARFHSAQAPRLRFLNGPQHGMESVISRQETTIGRAPGNDLVLDVADVSRHHARIEQTAAGLRLVDLGSTNGTRVNGSPVRATVLSPGDEVSFGTIRALLVDSE